MICPRCNVEMGPGIAIHTGEDRNARYLAAPNFTINAETLEIIDVLKCPKCGYSDDGTGPQK